MSEERNYDEILRGKHSVGPNNEKNNIEKNDEKNTNNKQIESVQNECFSKEFYFKFLEDNYIQLLFKDQFGEPFVYLKINEKDENHYEIMPLSGNRFENYLIKIFYESEHKIIPSKEIRNNIVDYLRAKVEFRNTVRPLELRIAKLNDDDYTFYYDLIDGKGQIIKITSDGWSIMKNPPILFRRYKHQAEQTLPLSISFNENSNNERDLDIDILDRFIGLLNIHDLDTILLLKCYIISLFIPDISKAVLILQGEHGSGKSSFHQLIKMLVDPSAITTMTFPKEINELIQILSHNQIVYFDNISILQDWISDQLCRAVTGSSFSRRRLYTDDEDIIYRFKRAIGINGINLVATKPDLLDRSIIISLERIQKERNRSQIEILKEFETFKPQLLGYIFDILVKVLQIKKAGGIKLNGRNRMADWEEYCEIISRCLGYTENEFLRVYQKNIHIQIDEAIEASPLSTVIIKFIEHNNNISNQETLDFTATELLEKLEEFAISEMRLTNIKTIKSWPKSPNVLSNRLNSIKTLLREKGIEIERYKDSNKTRDRKIRIYRILSSMPSISSDECNFIQNQSQFAENQSELWSTREKSEELSDLPSVKNNNDYAQKNISRTTDGMDDDNLRNKVKEYLVGGNSLKCHIKNCTCFDKEYFAIDDYLNHALKHKLPLYPSLSIIELHKDYGMIPRGNPWETYSIT